MRWVPALSDPQCVLITFATSTFERLLVAIDSTNTVHVAVMQAMQDSEEGGCSVRSVELYSCQLFPGQSSRILPCSVAVRCGVLAFVEAADLEAQERQLHVWQLAHHGALLPTPIRLTAPFCTHGPTVSVPKPLMGRFVLLKGCSAVEESHPFVSVHLFSLDHVHEVQEVQEVQDGRERHRLRKLYTHGWENVSDSTLFRRAHPLADHLLGIWNLSDVRLDGKTSEPALKSFVLVNLSQMESGEPEKSAKSCLRRQLCFFKAALKTAQISMLIYSLSLEARLRVRAIRSLLKPF